MSLAKCIKLVTNPQDAQAIRDLITTGISERDAIEQHLGAINNELTDVAVRVGEAGGTVDEVDRAVAEMRKAHDVAQAANRERLARVMRGELYQAGEQEPVDDILTELLNDFDTLFPDVADRPLQSESIFKIKEAKDRRDELNLPEERTKVAGFTSARIDSLLEDWVHVNGIETRARVAFVDPIDFVAATHPDVTKIEAEAVELDLVKLRAAGTPFLRIDTSGEIIGHEGRHRMMALAKAGYKSVPIVISQPEYTSDPSDMNLKGQIFTEDGKGIDLKIKNAVPILPENVDQFTSEAADLLFQEAPIAPRAAIQFTADQESIIRLTRASDLSSFLHESGHLFLEMEKRFSEKFGVSDEMRPLLDWLGVDSFDDITVDHHEKFAETFEVYLREGNSPSLKLRDAFAAFRRWILWVYRALGLSDPRLARADINPEIAEYMDRMLATEAELEEARANPAYDQYFRSQEQAGKSDAEWKEYQAQVQRAENRATMDLDQKVINELRKRKTQEWAEEREILAQEEAERLSQTLVYQAILKARETPMDRSAFKEVAGVKNMPPSLRNTTITKGGIDPSVLSKNLGYETVADMVNAMVEANTLKKAATAAAESLMIEKYGDMLNDGRIELEVRESIHNEEQAKLLLMEFQALNKKAGGQPSINLRKDLKARALAIISNSKYRDIKPNKFYLAEIKAAQKAGAAKTDWEARLAKRSQIINHYMYKAAIDATAETDKILRRLKRGDKVSARKKMRGEYILQRDALLERFDLRKGTSLKEIDRQSLAEFIESESERLSGIVIPIDPQIADERFRKHYKDMTLDELRSLDDAVTQLEHMANREHKMYIELRNMSFEEEKQSILAEFRKVHKKAFDKEGNPVPYRKNTKPLVKELYGRFKSKFDAEFINLENLLEIMTLGKGKQVFESLFERLSEASDQQSILMKKISDFLDPYTKAYSAKERLAFSMTSSRIFIKEVGEYFTREQRIAVALFNGNPEGRQRLRDGNKYNQQQMNAILETLEERDIDFVNALWEMSETIIWPLLKDVDTRTKGLPPKKVDSTPYTTSKGKFTGGYVPLVYDGDLDIRAYDYHAEDAIKELRGGSTTRAETRQSASKERLREVKRPLNLSLGAISYKINETIHDVTHREAVTDTYRLFKSKRIGDTIRTIAGPDVYKALLERVRETAVKPIVPQGFSEKFLWYARRNTLINMMGFSFNTMAINILGAVPAIRQVGPGRFLSALAKLATTDGRAMYKWVLEDPYMAERIRGYDRDLSMSVNRFMAKGNIGPKMSTWLIGLSIMDRAVTLPTWIAAYEKGMVKYNNDEKAAKQYAGRTVRQTNGSGRTIDLAKVSGGTGPAGEFKRMITMYYNFFSSQLAMNVVSQRISAREFSEGHIAQAASRMTLTVLATIVIPATLEALARGDCKDDDLFTCMTRSSILFTGQFFPLFRDIWPTMLKQFDPDVKAFGVRISPIESAMETVAKTPKAAADIALGDFTESDIKTLTKGLGYMLPGPGFQVSRTLDGYIDLMEGNEDNPMILLTGSPKR